MFSHTLTLTAVSPPTDRFPTVDSLTDSAGGEALSPDVKHCVGEQCVLYTVVAAYCHTEMHTAVLHQEIRSSQRKRHEASAPHHPAQHKLLLLRF